MSSLNKKYSHRLSHRKSKQDMPILSKLLGSGLGLASEAVHAARSRSRSRSDQAPVDASSNTAAPIKEAGRNHISEASRNPSRHGHPADAVSDDEVDSDAEDRQALGQDEAAWELDEMATQLHPPTYEQSQAAAGAESEDVKVRREEEMVRELVRKAGPPPHPIRRIPCPVILPQRRPRNKGRGFVRAYAPVLADCGISQEVFLEFLEKWDKASEVSDWQPVPACGFRVHDYDENEKLTENCWRHLGGSKLSWWPPPSLVSFQK